MTIEPGTARRQVVDAEGVGVLPWVVGPDGPGRGRLAGNLVLGAAVPLLALGGILRSDAPPARAVGIMVLALLVGAGLFFRSRWPLALLAVSLLGAVATVAVPEAGAPMILASQVAVFTVACNRPRRVASLAALATAVVLFRVARTDSTGPMTEPRMLIVLVWTALAFSLGVAVRTQRAYVEALAERARRGRCVREVSAVERWVVVHLRGPRRRAPVRWRWGCCPRGLDRRPAGRGRRAAQAPGRLSPTRRQPRTVDARRRLPFTVPDSRCPTAAFVGQGVRVGGSV